eukprot:TRINITY_DN20143_c0_g1_i1.p1 TRINITY_DN20143_c0_g1~~TRINITY_DN20143_c0_g1_i1.p1  ORF type:complete len:1311 (-),score=236.09 TRINITY_DN20143_c0_g1_i1:849-4781(-)
MCGSDGRCSRVPVMEDWMQQSQRLASPEYQPLQLKGLRGGGDGMEGRPESQQLICHPQENPLRSKANQWKNDLQQPQPAHARSPSHTSAGLAEFRVDAPSVESGLPASLSEEVCGVEHVTEESCSDSLRQVSSPDEGAFGSPLVRLIESEISPSGVPWFSQGRKLELAIGYSGGTQLKAFGGSLTPPPGWMDGQHQKRQQQLSLAVELNLPGAGVDKPLGEGSLLPRNDISRSTASGGEFHAQWNDNMHHVRTRDGEEFTRSGLREGMGPHGCSSGYEPRLGDQGAGEPNRELGTLASSQVGTSGNCSSFGPQKLVFLEASKAVAANWNENRQYEKVFSAAKSSAVAILASAAVSTADGKDEDDPRVISGSVQSQMATVRPHVSVQCERRHSVSRDDQGVEDVVVQPCACADGGAEERVALESTHIRGWLAEREEVCRQQMLEQERRFKSWQLVPDTLNPTLIPFPVSVGEERPAIMHVGFLDTGLGRGQSVTDGYDGAAAMLPRLSESVWRREEQVDQFGMGSAVRLEVQQRRRAEGPWNGMSPPAKLSERQAPDPVGGSTGAQHMGGDAAAQPSQLTKGGDADVDADMVCGQGEEADNNPPNLTCSGKGEEEQPLLLSNNANCAASSSKSSLVGWGDSSFKQRFTVVPVNVEKTLSALQQPRSAHHVLAYGGFGVIESPAPAWDTRVRRNSGKIQSGGSNCLVNQLPDECLCAVFSCLTDPRDRSSVAMVCMRWLMLQSHMRLAELSVSSAAASVELIDDEEDRRVEERQRLESSRVPRQPFWLVGDLTRSLEGRRATDVHLAAIAVGVQGRGGLGKLDVKGSLISSNSHITNVGLSAIGSCCQSLHSLALWGCAYIDDQGMKAIGQGCALLEKVDFYKCPAITDKGMRAVLEGCPVLTTVSIDNCQGIGSTSVQGLGEFCLKLMSLNISDSGHIGPAALSVLAKGCPSLKRLKLSNMKLDPECLHALGDHSVGLERLKLCRVKGLGEAGMRALGTGQGFVSLKALWVSHSPGITDGVLDACGQHCTQLQALSITSCDDITDDGIKGFLKGATCLQTLNLGACNSLSSNGVRFILAMAGTGSLRSLWLNECDGIRDRGVANSESITCGNLKRIHITRSMGVGNGCLAAVGRSCEVLEELDLTGLASVGDRGLAAVAEGCSGTLRSVNLTACNRVTDRGLIALARHCGHNLELLNLDGCTKITDRGLRAVAEWCTVLKDVDVSKSSITDEGLLALLNKRGSNFRSLSVAGCSGITDKCLPSIAASCKSLWALNLKNCPGLSRKAVARLEDRARGAPGKSSELSCLFLDN